MVVISLSYQSSTLLFTNLSNSLVIVLALMLPLFGMLFQMRFIKISVLIAADSDKQIPYDNSKIVELCTCLVCLH